MGTNLIAFVVVLGVLIFFHELGHFLIARLFGVGVERFSLGFGPRVFGKVVGRTDYRISAIPLGGYVKMVGEEPGSDIAPEDIPFSFTHKSLYKRFLIVAAGPLFNLLLAVFIFTGLFQIYGFQVINTTLETLDGAAAYEAGFRTGDTILSVDGDEVRYWPDVQQRITKSDGKPLRFVIRRERRQLEIKATPAAVAVELFGIDLVNYQIDGLEPALESHIKEVVAGMPAAKAGLMADDIIIAIDGQPARYWSQMTRLITSSQGKQLAITILRDGQELTVAVTPEITVRKTADSEVRVFKIGIGPKGYDRIKDLNLWQSLVAGTYETGSLIKETLLGIGRIINGTESAKSIGGPILIAQMAGHYAKIGVDYLARFTAWISITLAILNILPIPVLDGGHLLFFAIEAVIGKPVNERVRDVAQQVGLFLLLFLMMFALYNDITRTLFK